MWHAAVTCTPSILNPGYTSVASEALCRLLFYYSFSQNQNSIKGELNKRTKKKVKRKGQMEVCYNAGLC